MPCDTVAQATVKGLWQRHIAVKQASVKQAHIYVMALSTPLEKSFSHESFLCTMAFQQLKTLCNSDIQQGYDILYRLQNKIIIKRNKKLQKSIEGKMAEGS